MMRDRGRKKKMKNAHPVLRVSLSPRSVANVRGCASQPEKITRWRAPTWAPFALRRLNGSAMILRNRPAFLLFPLQEHTIRLPLYQLADTSHYSLGLHGIGKTKYSCPLCLRWERSTTVRNLCAVALSRNQGMHTGECKQGQRKTRAMSSPYKATHLIKYNMWSF